MHLCQFAITINVSCNFCKTDVVVSIFLFLFLLFFFFFLLTTAYSCVKVFVSTVVSCRFLGDAPLLGFCNVLTFFKNGNIKSLEGILCRITLIDTQYHLVAATFFFFFFQLLITQRQCCYIHVLTIHQARVNIGRYLASAIWPQVCTVDRVCIFAEPQTRQISTRPTEGHITS